MYPSLLPSGCAYLVRCLPRLVDVLRGEILQLGDVLPDVVTVLVGLLSEGDGAVASEVLHYHEIER